MDKIMRSGVRQKRQPPEMSITGGWNPPNDKGGGGGGMVGGGEDPVIRCRTHLLCTLAYTKSKIIRSDLCCSGAFSVLTIAHVNAGLIDNVAERHWNEFQMRKDALALVRRQDGEKVVLARVMGARHERPPNQRT